MGEGLKEVPPTVEHADLKAWDEFAKRLNTSDTVAKERKDRKEWEKWFQDEIAKIKSGKYKTREEAKKALDERVKKRMAADKQ
jgi:hypothetical protein